MASFEQHLNTAVISSGLIIAPLHASGILDINQSLLALTFGLIGGALPDIDSDNSKPVQIIFRILSIFVPLMVLLSISTPLSIVTMLLFWLVSSSVLYLIFFKLLLSFTVHRGVFHSIPMGLLMGQGVIYLFYFILQFDIATSTIAGLFLFFGFLTHLILDELVSLNAFGMEVKKSLGTALKLYDRENLIGTSIVYILIVTLYFILPLNYDNIIEGLEVLKEIKLSS